MPLAAAYPSLIQAIESAFENKIAAMEALPKEDSAAREAIKKAFYLELATAIHSYTMSATVITSVTTGVVGIAGPLAPVGACPVAGAGMGAGTGNLL